MILTALAAVTALSCGPRQPRAGGPPVITVTIPPFAWFVEQIAGDDFTVNVLLPPGADHHIWEPLPAQISALSGSTALIINGELDFERAWMSRFMQVNPGMQVLDLSRNIRLIGNGETGDAHSHDDGDSHGDAHSHADGDSHGDAHSHDDIRSPGGARIHSSEGGHSHSHGGPDPHYWMSPVAARTMASDLRDFLAALNPASAAKYDARLAEVNHRIAELDSLVRDAVSHYPGHTVLIYHPALAYMGRDYGFEQVSFEDEGKEPSPARMKQLIDLARERQIGIIFIQAEYDVRNARSLSKETGASLAVINPMNGNWPEAVAEVATTLRAGR